MNSSSQLFGGTHEECHSSESGWTMYIGSPISTESGDHHDDDDDDDDDDDGGGDDDHSSSDANNHEDDSDDSMASDASSGPSYQGNPYGNGARFKHEAGKINNGKCYSEMRASKSSVMEKQRAQRGRRNEEKEERVVVMGTTARANTAPAQSGSKVRKNIWMGKRK